MGKIEFVDADAHVVEAEMVGECLKRWPDSFTVPPDGSLGVMTEGRRFVVVDIRGDKKRRLARKRRGPIPFCTAKSP